MTRLGSQLQSTRPPRLRGPRARAMTLTLAASRIPLAAMSSATWELTSPQTGMRATAGGRSSKIESWDIFDRRTRRRRGLARILAPPQQPVCIHSTRARMQVPLVWHLFRVSPQLCAPEPSRCSRLRGRPWYLSSSMRNARGTT